jgi:hypothetical protein
VARVRDDAVSEGEREAVMVMLLVVAPLLAVMVVAAAPQVMAVADDVMVPRFVSPSHARPM